MPKTKKKFIDKKNSVTFHLVHRSQQDPLAADENAPQHVLLAAPERRSKEDKSRLDEQQKFGVFYDDDYNYLQHLRDANTLSVDWEPVETYRIQKTDKVPTKLNQAVAGKPAHRLNLPSSVFASEVEEEIGLLNKAAPQSGLRLDLDPDVIAAMDEDFDFSDPENELEDNFMELANAEGPEEDEEGSDQYETCSDSDRTDGSDSGREGSERSYAEEETKTRFTNYSMSSSIMRRTEHLSILDSRFEHMYAGYDDAEIGALDCDEIEGHMAPDDEMVLQCAEAFKRERLSEKHETDRSMVGRYLETLRESDTEEGDLEELEDLKIRTGEDKWDCESILSTYSNIYNHPKLIVEPKGPSRIRINPRTGVPLNVLEGKDGKLTANALAKLDAANESEGEDDDDAATVMSTLSILSIRPPNETPAERCERKKALKDYRKERRLERKANKDAFKEEKKRQEKVLLNNRKNQQGVHIF